MPHNSTTPRKLRITIELDVTEGPRLRRGTTRQDMIQRIGEPVMRFAARTAHESLGLSAQEAKLNVEWGYVWMQASQHIVTDVEGNEIATL